MIDATGPRGLKYSQNIVESVEKVWDTFFKWTYPVATGKSIAEVAYWALGPVEKDQTPEQQSFMNLASNDEDLYIQSYWIEVPVTDPSGNVDVRNGIKTGDSDPIYYAAWGYIDTHCDTPECTTETDIDSLNEDKLNFWWRYWVEQPANYTRNCDTSEGNHLW